MEQAVLEKYQKNEEEAEISFLEDGREITNIGNKAFLSCKSVKKLILADSVKKVGDWAFAHMQNLEILVLPCHEIVFGKKVFLDCEKLQQIQVRGDESGNPGMPWFLAAAVRILKNEGLCRPGEAGSAAMHREWIKEYDKALMYFLGENDEEGFEPVFIGWFHVEDTDEQIPRYVKKRRQEKAELVFLRLLYPDYLEEALKEKLYLYLREHMTEESKSSEDMSVLSIICDSGLEYGKDIRYMKILEKAGCLTMETTALLLEKMQDAPPEITAFLLRKEGEFRQGADYFSEFEL